MPFEGFYRPHYTQIPDELFDELLPELTGAELKVLLYIMRRTFGFKKDFDAISLQQICSGIPRKNGEPLDRGTGLHRETAVKAIRSLESKGCIIAERSSSPEKGDLPTVYALRLRPKGVGKTDSGSRKKLQLGVGLSDPQETDLQETEELDPLAIRLYALLNACKPDDRAEVRAHLAELGNGERVGRAIGRAESEWDRRKGPREFWRRVEWWLENGG